MYKEIRKKKARKKVYRFIYPIEFTKSRDAVFIEDEFHKGPVKCESAFDVVFSIHVFVEYRKYGQSAGE